MKTRRLLAATLFLALGSCTSKDDPADAPAAAAAAAAEGTEKIEIAARGTPTIEVTDPGQEPRTVLRLHPAAGTVDVLDLSMGVRMSMQNGPQAMPSIPVPITKTRMRAEVLGVAAEGIEVANSVDSVDVVPVEGTPPQVLEQVRASVEPLTKYTAKMRMDDRGGVLGGYAEIPRNLPAPVQSSMTQMTQSLGQIAVPLPAPALGVGARWTATQEIDQNGMRLQQVAHYTLTSLEGDRAQMAVTLTQSLLDSEIDVPGMLGAKARISDFSSAGQGTFELDLAHVIPTSVNMTIDLSMTMDMTVLGQNQHVEMDMSMDMDMTRADGV